MGFPQLQYNEPMPVIACAIDETGHQVPLDALNTVIRKDAATGALLSIDYTDGVRTWRQTITTVTAGGVTSTTYAALVRV